MKKKVDVVKIYIIYDLSGKHSGYIGVTSRTLQQRLKAHFDRARSDCSWHIYNAIRQLKYRVKIMELETMTVDKYQQAERLWISHFKSLGWNLWNMTDGGDGVIGLQRSGWSDEARKRQSMNKKGKKRSQYARDRIRAGKLGTHLTVEHRKAISDGCVGLKHKKRVRSN